MIIVMLMVGLILIPFILYGIFRIQKHNKSLNSNSSLWIVPTILILAALIFIGIGISYFSQYSDSTNWNSVHGKIIVNNCIKINKYQKYGDVNEYHSNLLYEYFINEKQYIGSQYHLRINDMLYPDFMICKKYNSNNNVTVYYNPQKPQESVLKLGFNPFTSYFTGGFFALLFAYALFRYIYKIDHPK